MKLLNKIGFVLVGLIVVLGLPMLQVWAEEDSTVKDYYLYQTFHTTNGSDWNSSFTSDYSGPLYFVQGSNYPYGFDKNGNLMLLNLDNGFVGSVFRDGNLYSSKFYLYSDNAHGFEIDSISTDTNVPIFTSVAALQSYIESGDDSGWINKPDPEEFNYFSLSGFQYDDSISASWSGIQTDLQLIKNHVNDVEVVVSPSFFLILEPGENYEKFKEPESLVIPLSGSFKGSYDSFFEGNPYKGRALLTLDFYPRYYDSATGNMYRGDSISVMFDAKGKITDVDFPEASLIPVYDPGCHFDSPASSTVDVSGAFHKTFFRWNKVVTSYVYKSNYIAVDIGYDGKWYPYSIDEFFFSSNSISLTYAQVSAFLNSYDLDFSFADAYKIRYTPYYKTSSGVYYGKPIIVSDRSKSITEVDGDYLDGSKIPNYIDISPTDWFEDSTLWDNVEYVTDHIKDDLDGAVDLDNLSFNFFKMLKSVIDACGQFPALVATVFSFLPSDISKLLVISLSLIIIMRILGR